MTRVGEALIRAANGPRDGAEQLVQQAVADGDIDTADFAFLFCSRRMANDAFIDQLHEELSALGADWVGCTTAGEISGAGATRNSAVLLIISSDDISFSTGVGTNVYEQPVTAGEAAATAAGSDEFQNAEHRVLHTLIAGQTLTNRGVEFDVLQGVVNAAGADVPVVGGSAGDDDRFHHTLQFHNGEVYRDAVVATAIHGAHGIIAGQEHGLHDIAATGVVNNVDGRVIKTISGQPAAEFYADAVGVDVSELRRLYMKPLRLDLSTVLHYLSQKLLGNLQLEPHRVFDYALTYSIAIAQGQDNYRVVTPLSVTREHGLVMTTEVPENTPLYIVHGEREDVISAGGEAFQIEDQNPVFAVVSDCMCRNHLLSGDELDAEVRTMRERLGCPVIGFYGYGEIGGKGEQYTTFKNQTVSGFVVTDDR